MSGGRILYWLLTGACLGFGVIAILCIGIFFLAAGLILLVFGAIRFQGKGLWAALVGFGGAPALILIWDVTSGPWGCMAPGGGTSQPGRELLHVRGDAGWAAHLIPCDGGRFRRRRACRPFVAAAAQARRSSSRAWCGAGVKASDFQIGLPAGASTERNGLG